MTALLALLFVSLDPAELLSQVSDRYSNLKHYSVLITQTQTSSPELRRFRIDVADGGKYLIHFGRAQYISDGKSLFLYVPKENKYSVRESTSDLGVNMADNIYSWVGHFSDIGGFKRYKLKFQGYQDVEGGPGKTRCAVVVMRPKKEDWSSVTQTFWIDPESHLVLKYEQRIGGAYSDSNLYHYSFLPSDPRTLSFAPPPGAMLREPATRRRKRSESVKYDQPDARLQP